MALDVMKTLDIIEALENYLERIRPPVEMRNELDFAYTIENQSIFIFEVRPRWDQPEVYYKSPVAKTTFIHTKTTLENFLDAG